MLPTAGNSVAGVVNFHQQDEQLLVEVVLSGLQPNSVHGFHVHEKGDCSSPDGTSAGGHFNPDSMPHGPQQTAHHAGDMPAVQADAYGNVHANFRLRGVSIGAAPADLVGRSVILHASPDDYKTQPTGNSGARIACGVIKTS